MNQIAKTSSGKTRKYKEPLRVAVVSSSWHRLIVRNAIQSIKAGFKQNHSLASKLGFFEVSGAFELPLHALRLAQSGEYDAIIACGLVVDGGIYRHEFVASAVIDGLMQVQLQSGIPVFSAVLTPHNFHESEEHTNFFAMHFKKKGTEVARTCIETVERLKKLPGKRA